LVYKIVPNDALQCQKPGVESGFFVKEKRMRKFSFKLFSTNLTNNPKVVRDVAAFVRSHPDTTFMELMVVPDTPEERLKEYASLFNGLMVTIHAPHNAMGFDTGRRDLEKANRRILENAQLAADLLKSDIIVVHAGCGHNPENLKETARQFKLFNDKRVVIENLPYDAKDTPDVLHGNTPEEIKYVMNEAGCGFCFDFSHAVCAANHLHLDIEKQLQGFYDLKPAIYHICDGDMSDVWDDHRHFGDGNFPLKHFLLDYTATDARITMETGRGIPVNLTPWENDYNYMQKILTEEK